MKSVWREPPSPPEHPPFCAVEQILLVPLRSQSVTLIMTTDSFLGSGKVVTVLPGWLSPSSGNFDQGPWGWEPMSRKYTSPGDKTQVHQGPLPFTTCVILGKPLSFWGLFSFLFGKAEIMTQAQIKQQRDEKWRHLQKESLCKDGLFSVVLLGSNRGQGPSAGMRKIRAVSPEKMSKPWAPECFQGKHLAWPCHQTTLNFGKTYFHSSFVSQVQPSWIIFHSRKSVTSAVLPLVFWC